MASVITKLGRLDEAESLTRRTLDSQRRVLGAEHPSTLTTISQLGGLLQDRGRLDEAEALLRPCQRRNFAFWERIIPLAWTRQTVSTPCSGPAPKQRRRGPEPVSLATPPAACEGRRDRPIPFPPCDRKGGKKTLRSPNWHKEKGMTAAVPQSQPFISPGGALLPLFPVLSASKKIPGITEGFVHELRFRR